MDEKSVSFQMFLILLSFITLGSESQIFFSVQAISKRYSDVWGGGGGLRREGGGRMRRSQNFFSEEKNFIRHFARFNFSRLLLAFISKYYPILHVVKR